MHKHALIVPFPDERTEKFSAKGAYQSLSRSEPFNTPNLTMTPLRRVHSRSEHPGYPWTSPNSGDVFIKVHEDHTTLFYVVFTGYRFDSG